MIKLNFLSIVLFALLSLCNTAQAGEAVVLLPLAGPLTTQEKAELTQQIVAGLAPTYEVKHGAEVDRFVSAAFKAESSKKDCDEINCYRRIAAQYAVEKIVAVRVVLVSAGHYMMTLNVYDVTTNEMTASHKKQCAACSFEKLKSIGSELTGMLAGK